MKLSSRLPVLTYGYYAVRRWGVCDGKSLIGWSCVPLFFSSFLLTRTRHDGMEYMNSEQHERLDCMVTTCTILLLGHGGKVMDDVLREGREN